MPTNNSNDKVPQSASYVCKCCDETISIESISGFNGINEHALIHFSVCFECFCKRFTEDENGIPVMIES